MDFSPVWRGGQQQLLMLARGLRRLGVEQTIVARHAAVGTRFRADGFAVAGSHRPARADVVHAHDGHAHTWILLRANGRRVLTRRVAFPVRGFLSRWKYRRLDLVIAVSKEVSRTVPAGPPVLVIPDGIELPVPATPAPPRWPPGARALVCLGTDSPEKGLSDLFAAFARLPSGCHLVLTALPGGGLPDRIHGTAESGWDAAAWVAACDLLVMPSRQEGLGSAALVAMALGKPVVATTAGGIPELVADGVTGLLVPPADPAALAATLQRLLADPELGLRLGAAGRARAFAHHGADQIAAATLAAYHRVL